MGREGEAHKHNIWEQGDVWEGEGLGGGGVGRGAGGWEKYKTQGHQGLPGKKLVFQKSGFGVKLAGVEKIKVLDGGR